MKKALQCETRILRLLSLACKSSANATIQCSLIEASLLNETLDETLPGVSHFVDAAFSINVALLKGLDNMVTTDYEEISTQISELRGFVNTQPREVA